MNETPNTTTIVTPEDALLLWLAATPDGLMVDGGATDDAAERLCAAGLVSRADPIDYIKVFRINAAGASAMGVSIQ